MVHHNHYSPYVALSKGALVDELRTLADDTISLQYIDEATSLTTYAPGKWSIREVIQHLSDCERIMGYRALRIARADALPLAGFDEDAYVTAAEADRRSARDLLSELHVVRLSNHALFASFGNADQPTWKRRGIANNAEVDVEALAAIIVGHAAHHVNILRSRYGIPLP